ncbi:MAG: formylmethanofuran--tetrahydromethanopterin N-formyltransferase [Methanocalculus sp. MSAO_Arc1]|uniref:formylmethanofuran--tetrahydromethanopterin N-formyltransferase n=1 Tax=Methanocalculus TaxID=71151 RepID=UPI000FF45802|nr:MULTISPECIES: formylmethanofuran--tetrahydromethanopterin N-formyltransferase [unclassified Methanocalculus]MCP1662296.1 formylmethanofuran--tetrahydromethanopterin N-formyltransferase [Methanocalculus sp. AMF5]RQD80943.1 MAG: formylmethanofuran--tetrahydromethanopterin N-formyltransferase [Methanocalculus sp. MSAO_Arc1]
MQRNDTVILDTFAEAFPIWVSRVIVTADSLKWAYVAAGEAAGFATSKIYCPCEAGIEGEYTDTPDGRPGVSILICGEKKQMRSLVADRISQCILPAPTASAYDGLPDAVDRFFTRMHYFGDGYEERCTVGGRQCWKIPVMEGYYIGEERFGTVKGIAGGNFLVMSDNQRDALAAAEAAVEAINPLLGVITSFAGGIVGSGSKVGCSNYRFPMPASTNHRLCPALRETVQGSQVPDGVTTIYEIVINGIGGDAIQSAMKAGITAAVATGGVLAIGASNFDGRLGPHRFALHDLF